MPKAIESKFHCRHCNAELGATDGVRLLIACLVGDQQLVLEFRHLTKPHCPVCSRLTPWYPAESQVKKVDAISGLVVA